MSDSAFRVIASSTNLPIISTADLSWLAQSCQSSGVIGKPGLIIHLCRHISDLPVPRAMSGPIQSLPFDMAIIRQHLLDFGINDINWLQHSGGFANTALQIACYLIEPLGLAVVRLGRAAALYLCEKGLPAIFHPHEVDRNQSPIESPMLNPDTSPRRLSSQMTDDEQDRSLASQIRDEPDQGQADPQELAATIVDPDQMGATIEDQYEMTATIVDVGQYQDQAEEYGSIQGESSNELTTTPNKGSISVKARNGAGRGRPRARQPEKSQDPDRVQGRVKKGKKAGKGADTYRPKVTRATTKLHHLSP